MDTRLVDRKLIERALRMAPAVLLLAVLTPILLISLLRDTPQFESTATIWISDADEFSGISLGSESIFDTPAQRQVNVINQLLSTEPFAHQIAVDAELIADDAGPIASDRAINWVQSHVFAFAIGANLLALTSADPDPDHALAMTNAAVSSYLGRVADESSRRTQIQIDFYQDRLAQAEQILAERRNAVTTYLTSSPGAAAFDVFDPDYLSLSTAFDAQQLVVTGLQSALQSAELDAVSAEQGAAARYAIQDTPSRPRTAAGGSLTKTLGLPLAAAMLALGLGVAWVYISAQADHTIRSTADLEEIGLPVIGFVPEVRRKNRLMAWLTLRFRRDRHFVRGLAGSIPNPNDS